MAYYFRLPLITDLTIAQQAALNEVKPIAISGGPGTGKSVVSLWRHIRNHALGTHRSILLTFTKTLEKYLSETARSENEVASNEVGRTLWWTYKNPSEYDGIIIDEAQDVEASAYNILKEYSPIVSYGADDQQILYPARSTREAELRILFPDNIRYELFENFRNTHEILRFDYKGRNKLFKVQ